MLASKSLRWSAAAIDRGRQRLSTNPAGARLYSLPTSTASSMRRCSARPERRTIPRYSVDQVRAISLWGWGSSNSSQADFGKVHTPRSSSGFDGALGHDGQTLARQASQSSKSISAVHQTSDVPPLESIPLDQGPVPSSMTSSPWEQPAGTPDEFSSVDALDPAEAFASIPERIGYLKEVCGLDFGFGPTSLMEMTLEHIHIYGAVSWGISIAVLATLSRLVLFTPMAQASDASARMKAAQETLAPVRQRLSASYKTKDYVKMAEAKAELNVIQKEYGIKTSRMFLPLAFQAPTQFAAYRLLKNMAVLPVPGLKRESWLWMSDLTLGDPFYILPVANAALLYLIIKRGGEMGNSQLQGGLMASLLYIMPCLSFVFISFQPGTVQLYFIFSAVLAYFQSRLLTNDYVRRSLGLHPMVRATTPQPTPGGSTAAADRKATITHTSTFGPGGLKLYQPPPSTAPLPAAAPPAAAAKANDASIIDRFVDNAKSRKAEAVDGIYNMMGTSKEQRIKDAQSRKDDAVAERYEKRMAQENEMRREQRNRDKIARTERSKGGGFDASPSQDAPTQGRERGRRRERR